MNFRKYLPLALAVLFGAQPMADAQTTGTKDSNENPIFDGDGDGWDAPLVRHLRRDQAP